MCLLLFASNFLQAPHAPAGLHGPAAGFYVKMPAIRHFRICGGADKGVAKISHPVFGAWCLFLSGQPHPAWAQAAEEAPLARKPPQAPLLAPQALAAPTDPPDRLARVEPVRLRPVLGLLDPDRCLTLTPSPTDTPSLPVWAGAGRRGRGHPGPALRKAPPVPHTGEAAAPQPAAPRPRGPGRRRRAGTRALRAEVATLRCAQKRLQSSLGAAAPAAAGGPRWGRAVELAAAGNRERNTSQAVLTNPFVCPRDAPGNHGSHG